MERKTRKKKYLLFLSYFTIAAGILAILGWIFNLSTLKAIFPGLPPMRFNPALVLISLGVSFYCLVIEKRKHLLQILCSLIIVYGIACIYQGIAKVNFGFDEFFIKDVEALHIGYPPGRPPVSASICFILMAAAFLILSTEKGRMILIAQYFLHFVSFLSFLVILGYILNYASYYKLYFFTSLSLNMAISLFLLSIGASFLHDDKGMASLFSGNKTGNIMARRLFPLTFFFLVLITFLRVITYNNKWATEETGIAIIITLFAIAALLIIWYNTEHLNRLEEKRRIANENLRQKEKEYVANLEKINKDLSDYKLALDAANDVTITDQHGIIQEANDNFCKLSKYSHEELIGKNHHFINSGYHSEEFFQNLWKTITAGKIWRGEVRNKAKDGTFFWVNTTIIPFIDESPYKYVAIRTDITERMHAHEALAESEEKFRNFYENSLVAEFFTDMKTAKITDVNQVGAKLFGYNSKKEFLEKFDPNWHFVKPEMRKENFDIVKKEGVHTNRLQEMKKLDGTHFWIQQYIVLNSKKNTAQTIVLDITAQIKAHQELEGKIRELENANKELESFNYILSHDLQEPLQKIQSFAGMLQKEEMNLAESGKDYLQRLLRSAERSRALINDVLIYSRTHSAERIFEKTDLNEIFNQAVDSFNGDVLRKNAIFTNEVPCKVKAIRFQLRQVFINLIGNSLKFASPERQLQITARSEITEGSKINNPELSQEINYCHITYQDNSIGFEPQYGEKVFELFERLNHNKYPGTGIGLAICKKIIQNHHGIITAAGKPNVGARFDIYIPC